MAKIIWKGPVFHPTGIATASRETLKALEKRGHKIQVTDVWTDKDINKGLEHWNNAIKPDKNTITIFADYPQFWKDSYGKSFGWFVHEGTRLQPGWDILLNRMPLFVPSNAVKNMFRWNGVTVPIEVIPHGVNELYKPTEKKETDEFIFLSVNSWTGRPNDRKGTDLLIKAFDEEFKNENVKLLLKISTFWQKPVDYGQAIFDLLGHKNENILFNDKYISEEELVTYYQKSDCFVAPTKGEGFGLTILNAMACGLPVVVTKDNNSGHMDFCRGKDSVVWIENSGTEQGDLQFYAEGNMLAKIEIDEVRKALRKAYNERKILKEKAINSKIREEYSWDNTAKKIEEMIYERKSNS